MHFPLDFDLIDLRLFVNTAEANSITRGAELSFISVPSASTRIKNMEDRLGLKLLYRSRDGVSLTSAGEAFLFHGRQVLQQLEHLRGDLREYSRGVKGHLRISATTASITEFLPPLLRQYLSTHSEVSVDLRERLSADIVRALVSGSTDIGIVADVTPTGDLEAFPYRSYRHVLATPIKHPLAKEASTTFERTLDYDFVAPAAGTVMYAFLRHAADRCSKSLRVRIEVPNFEALCRMIEGEIGIGMLPEPSARRFAQTMNIRIVELEDAWARRNLLVCVRDVSALPAFAVDFLHTLSADSRESCAPSCTPIPAANLA
jgi:DNA-binding transcriptional LysR family regulator